jgi:hypothetical protein
LDLGYVQKKLITAIHGMAVSPKPLQERIVHAYTMSLIDIREDDLPSDLHAEHKNLKAALEDAADSSKMMDDDRAWEVACLITQFHDKVLARSAPD